MSPGFHQPRYSEGQLWNFSLVVFYEAHHRFVKNRPCPTNLSIFLVERNCIMNEDRAFEVRSLDFSEVFGSVNQFLLHYKPSAFDITVQPGNGWGSLLVKMALELGRLTASLDQKISQADYPDIPCLELLCFFCLSVASCRAWFTHVSSP